jgi:hypothetical protein
LLPQSPQQCTPHRAPPLLLLLLPAAALVLLCTDGCADLARNCRLHLALHLLLQWQQQRQHCARLRLLQPLLLACCCGLASCLHQSLVLLLLRRPPLLPSGRLLP